MTAGADLAGRPLRASGYRVLEQRFPRRAYVVIREPKITVSFGIAGPFDEP
jgi:hypothetical protein